MRRGVTRLATVVALLVGLLAAGATPAVAAEDQVQLRLPGSFTVGESAGQVSVVVTRRAKGCVKLRTTLAIRLPGLTADRVRVSVADDGEWERVSLTNGGDGLVLTERVKPKKDKLCERKAISVRFRVAFLDGSPGGAATIAAGAYEKNGELLGQAGASRPVTGAPPVSPPTASPTPSPSPTASPSPTPEASATSSAPPSLSAPLTTRDRGGVSGLVLLGIGLGVAMVGVGIALLVLLLRRGRGGNDGPEPGGPPYPGPGGPYPGLPPAGGGDPAPTLILPKLPR